MLVNGVMEELKTEFWSSALIRRSTSAGAVAGDYKKGDYVIEPANAIHDAVLFEEEVLLIMRSTGDVAFLTEDNNVMFMMDRGMLTGFAAS